MNNVVILNLIAINKCVNISFGLSYILIINWGKDMLHKQHHKIEIMEEQKFNMVYHLLITSMKICQ